MPPTARTPARIPHDYAALAKAFDGLAGALHDGHAVECNDLEEACRLAHELWPVRGGGRDACEEEFEACRLECLQFAPLAAAGDMRAWAQLTRSCHSVALALRARARELARAPPRRTARPWKAAAAVRTATRRLDGLYARHAMPAVLLPL